MAWRDYVGTVEGAVEDAMSIVSELAEEMRERFDNAPENLKGSDVNSRVEQCADLLEGASAPDLPAIAGEIAITVKLPISSRPSRRFRLDEAMELLEAAQAALIAWAEDNEEHEQLEEANTAADELEELVGELDDAEFPGMIG